MTRPADPHFTPKTSPEAAPENGPRKSVLSLGRRELAAGFGAAAGVVLLGGAAKLGAAMEPEGKQGFIRPPGALPEADFLSKCTRCGRCLSVCHTGAVENAGLSQGFINWRTPVMMFSKADCDFCRRCAEVCPTGALTLWLVGTVQIGVAELTQSCIALRTGGCTKCWEECPYDAIYLNAKRAPVIDAERCCGCGVCEKVCPALVLQSMREGAERGIVVRPIQSQKNKKNGGAS